MVQFKKLSRELGLIDVFAISAGAMISSGIFVLPGIIFAHTGPALILAYIFAAMIYLPAVFAKIELTTAMPKAGGTYFFIERSMGAFLGVLGGLACFIALSLKSAFALVGIGAFIKLLYPSISIFTLKIIFVILAFLFTIINLIGVKLAGRIQVILVLVLLGLLGVYIITGATQLDVHKYTPFMQCNLREFFAASGAVLISYIGLTKVASIAEETRNPARNLPYGMLLGFIIVSLVYFLTVFVTVGLVPSQELRYSLTPISKGAKIALGKPGFVLLSIGAVFAFITTANAGIMAASRYPVAMARDQLFPEFFANVNKKFNTPDRAIIATGLLILISLVLLDIESLVKLASIMQIILFVFILISSLIMRASKILNYKPSFYAPLYPGLHIVGVLIYIGILIEMGKISLISLGVFFGIGLLWYVLYVRGRGTRKSALAHIIERITGKEFAGESLSQELREVIRERDEIIEDRFDRLVHECDVLDIEGKLTLEEFLQKVSFYISQKINIPEEKLYNLLLKREKESTTVIRTGLAIPHIIIEGEKKFYLFVIRVRPGVIFNKAEPPVYAIFILLGTKDERNFHLRALAAIAQIVQDANFDRTWLRAKTKEELRDILLLAERHREKS